MTSPAINTPRPDLVAAREAAGLTQEQVAVALGCNQSTVARYENGERQLFRVAPRMAQVLGIETIAVLYPPGSAANDPVQPPCQQAVAS